MTSNLPTRNALKQQAKRLREAMVEAGTPLSQSQALETVARQHGARDWNTLVASAPMQDPARWQVGTTVHGRYLGQTFRGRIKAAREASGGYWHLTLVFDKPVDVVTSAAFSNLRSQVNCVVNGQGVSVEKTSDGTPHMAVFAS